MSGRRTGRLGGDEAEAALGELASAKGHFTEEASQAHDALGQVWLRGTERKDLLKAAMEFQRAISLTHQPHRAAGLEMNLHYVYLLLGDERQRVAALAAAIAADRPRAAEYRAEAKSNNCRSTRRRENSPRPSHVAPPLASNAK